MLPEILPEDRLCLLLARRQLLPPAREEARELLVSSLRWDRVLNHAKAHEVYSLLYRNLENLGFCGVPAQVRSELEGMYRMNALQNSLLAQELAQVLGLLGEAGVPVIPLKGVTLAESLYGDISLRSCADIDILVPRRMAIQAYQFLASRGYEPLISPWFLANRTLLNSYEYSLLRRRKEFCSVLELHWGVIGEPLLDEEALSDLWAEAQPKVYFAVPAFTLSPEWEFFYLATHAARHNWQRLKWIVDIHEASSREDINWEKLKEMTERLRWEKLVGIGITVCHTLLGTPVPPHFSAEELPRGLKLFPSPPSPLSMFHHLFLYLRLLRRPSEKLRFLFRRFLVPTPPDYRLVCLPPSLGFLYYLVRPFRILFKIASELLVTRPRNGKTLAKW